MAEFCFLFCTTVAAFQPVGLVSVEVRYGTYFQPAFLCFGVYFEVETKRSSKAHITTTKAEYTVWKFQFLQQAFYVVKHLLVGFFRMFRLVDTH